MRLPRWPRFRKGSGRPSLDRRLAVQLMSMQAEPPGLLSLHPEDDEPLREHLQLRAALLAQPKATPSIEAIAWGEERLLDELITRRCESRRRRRFLPPRRR
ncbi:MAG TPA: hypothetical protein VNL92_04450 [Dehalococcoidia bacterium]|nr:hypothetical protein [Dehalococcoidia bacterium]